MSQEFFCFFVFVSNSLIIALDKTLNADNCLRHLSKLIIAEDTIDKAVAQIQILKNLKEILIRLYIFIISKRVEFLATFTNQKYLMRGLLG